jgi:hypothetical protein
MHNPASGRATSRCEWLWDRAAIRRLAIELRSGATAILNISIIPHENSIVPAVLIDAPTLRDIGYMRSSWQALLPSEDTRGMARLDLAWATTSIALIFDLGNQQHRDCLRIIQRSGGRLALGFDPNNPYALIVNGLADAILAAIIRAGKRAKQ